MREYVAGLSARLETEVKARWYVDDGPMLDRAAARRSGLGWFGKNTNILTPELGSWVFLGQVITDLEIEPDGALKKTCGSCVRCIEACPTGAIIAPYVIDNSRCISYLTIENRGPIPRELRPQMLDWVFGCDICQEVCPVNRKASVATEPAFQRKELSRVDLLELLDLSEEGFREKFRGTPILRAKRVGLKRNACVALGNLKDPAAIPELSRSLVEEETLVRSHAAWALGQIGGQAAKRVLLEAQASETDADVLAEICDALRGLEAASLDSA
jgi:epoxyqueuosine reductase